MEEGVRIGILLGKEGGFLRRMVVHSGGVICRRRRRSGGFKTYALLFPCCTLPLPAKSPPSQKRDLGVSLVGQ